VAYFNVFLLQKATISIDFHILLRITLSYNTNLQKTVLVKLNRQEHDFSVQKPVVNSNAMSTQTTCPGKIAVVMSRLMTFSSETVLLNCAAILASVSFSDTCDHPQSKLVSTHQCQNTLVEKHFGLKKHGIMMTYQSYS